MEKISVIVPVYNVSQYLRKCIDSILEQDYKNFEIILINDGSTDDSGKICDEYAGKYKNINVYHQKNGGISSARNLGVSKVTGKYIAFVDSDDFIMKDFLSSMYSNLKNNNVDISCCGSYCYFNENKITNPNYINVNRKYSKDEAQKHLNIIGYFNCGVWNKLYKREVFDGVIFPVGKKSEDMYVMHKLINTAINGLYYSSEPKYFYRQREGSITNTSNINYDVIDAIEETYRFYKENKIEIAIPYAIQNLAFVYIGLYNTIMIRTNDKEKMKELRNRVLKLKKEIVYDGVSKSRKIQLFLFLHTKVMYNIVFKLFDSRRKRAKKE